MNILWISILDSIGEKVLFLVRSLFVFQCLYL